MTSARDLADRFHQRWLQANPFMASMYGIPGYDDLVPDESDAGLRAWRAEVADFLAERRDDRTPDARTGRCGHAGLHDGAVTQELAVIDSAQADHTVTAMPYSRPTFMAVAARTVLVDAAAAQAYLTRLRGQRPLDRPASERLRTGAGQGRLPVAPLIEQATPGPRPSWPNPLPDRCWRPSRRRLGPERLPGKKNAGRPPRDLVRQRWPGGSPPSGNCSPGPGRPARPDWRYLPGGQEDYARAVRIYTTLPRSPEELHQTGLDQVAALEARAVESGAGLGLSGLGEVFAALRASAGQMPPEEAIRQAAVAVKRAEARAAEVFPNRSRRRAR